MCSACGQYLRFKDGPFSQCAATCGTTLCSPVRYKRRCYGTLLTSSRRHTHLILTAMRIVCYICFTQVNAREGPHMVAPKTCGNVPVSFAQTAWLIRSAGHVFCFDCFLIIVRNEPEPRCPVCREPVPIPGGLIHIHPKYGASAYHRDLFQNLLAR